MAEPYNFSQWLKQTVKPPLNQMGFTLKSTKFMRTRPKYKESIYFQRYAMNTPGAPFQFYLNIGFVDGPNGLFGYGRFARPTDFPFPLHYQPIYDVNLKPEARNQLFESFTDAQKEEIKEYNKSMRWEYESEAELNQRFEESVEALKSVVDLFFNELDSKINENTSQIEANTIVHELALKYYHRSIPEKSRAEVYKKSV